MSEREPEVAIAPDGVVWVDIPAAIHSDPKIEPALTAEEWANVVAREYCPLAGHSFYPRILDGRGLRIGGGDCDGEMDILFAGIPSLIAVANAALPDDDPRKITREKLDLMRYNHNAAVAEFGGEPSDVDLKEFADALESYLPPI